MAAELQVISSNNVIENVIFQRGDAEAQSFFILFENI